MGLRFTALPKYGCTRPGADGSTWLKVIVEPSMISYGQVLCDRNPSCVPGKFLRHRIFRKEPLADSARVFRWPDMLFGLNDMPL